MKSCSLTHGRQEGFLYVQQKHSVEGNAWSVILKVVLE